MATGTYAPDPDLRVVDSNGTPVSGGLVWTYVAGTTTPAVTYADVGLTVPNNNPIVAGSDGRFVAFLTPGISYKFVYEQAATPPAHGAVIITRDNLVAVPTSVIVSPPIVQTTTLTGTQNDFQLTPDCSILYCRGSSLLTITGMSPGRDGQRITIVAVLQRVDLVNQSTGSAQAGRLFNWVTSGNTPLSPQGTGLGGAALTGGTATYLYDQAIGAGIGGWRLIVHEQGAWIDVPFNAANYTPNTGTWTVSAGNIVYHKYRLNGRRLDVLLSMTNTNIGSTPPNALNISGVPYTSNVTSITVGRVSMGGTWELIIGIALVNWTYYQLQRYAGAPPFIVGTLNMDLLWSTEVL